MVVPRHLGESLNYFLADVNKKLFSMKMGCMSHRWGREYMMTKMAILDVDLVEAR